MKREGESLRGKVLYVVLPPHIYDLIVRIARVRKRSISDTVRYFLLKHYDLLEEYYEEERARSKGKSLKQRKKEEEDEVKGEEEEEAEFLTK